jgi:SAM-dependent methyltransferase
MNLKTTDSFHDKDFWEKENLRYLNPHFRLLRLASIVNKLGAGKECDLLDLGCGPATLAGLLLKNIHYYGIDIAIHSDAPNLREFDFVENEISFTDHKFDFIIASGIIEYMGNYQNQKFAEIKSILKPNGYFILSYKNFGHFHKSVPRSPYNNIHSIRDFQKALSQFFTIINGYPVSHNWHQSDPLRKWLRDINMRISFNIPVISPLFAVQYLFICKP